MVSFPRTTITSLALTAALLLIPAAVTAQQGGVNQFFESNAVDNFTVPVVSKDGMGFQFFMDNEAKKKQIEEDLLKQNAAQPQAVPPKPEQSAISTNPRTAEEIVAAYGDPASDMPVLAQDNAPKPFKAMMAAFEAGDEQLAQGYARQWVRYMGNIQKRTERVLEVARAVQAGDRVASGSGPEGNRIRQMIVNDNSSLPENVDPRIANMIKQAEREQAAPETGKNDLEQQELKVREGIRKQMAGRVPADPQGKVDVYIFFAPNDPQGAAFAPIANQIGQRVALMKNAHFATFSTARLNRDALMRERRRLSLKTDLLVGDSFARELKLTTLPAVILVSPSTGKIIRESADKPFVFYDELIAAVQGRK